jgi:hypothetical protein
MAGLASVTAQVRIIASKPTSEAAMEVEKHMMTLKSEFFEYDNSGKAPTRDYDRYLKGCADRLDAFVEAADRELEHTLLKAKSRRG